MASDLQHLAEPSVSEATVTESPSPAPEPEGFSQTDPILDPWSPADPASGSAAKALKASVLRCCAHPAYAKLEQLAKGNNIRTGALLDILWRVHAPPSLRALSVVARNLWSSLVMLRSIFGVDLEAFGLDQWLCPLEWLDSDEGVRKLSGLKENYSGNQLRHHCTTSHSIYAICGDKACYEFDCLRALLILLYVQDAEVRTSLADYELHLRKGADLTVRGHSPYEAWLAMHYLANGSANQLLDVATGVTALETLVDRIADQSIPDALHAIRRWPGLVIFVRHLWDRIPSDRRTLIAPKSHRPASLPQPQRRSGSSNGHSSHSGPGGSHESKRYIPTLSDRERRRLAESDTSPLEKPGLESLWIIEQPECSTAEPAADLAQYRAQTRAMHRPVDLMPFHERNLSIDEIEPLISRAHRLAENYRSQGHHDPASERELQFLAVLLCSYFTSRDPEEAAAVIVLGPHGRNADAALAILLADESRHDCFRLRSLKIGNQTDAFDPLHFRRSSDFVWLPLPPVVGFVVRSLVSGDRQSITEPVRLCRLNESQMHGATQAYLRHINYSGRLTAGRLQHSFFAAMVAETGGDIALSSLVLAQRHTQVDAEMYYLSAGTRDAAELYRTVADRIHRGCLPEWRLNEASVEEFIPDLDLGCPYPRISELRNRIRTVCDLAREAWTAIPRKTEPSDPAFEDRHNKIILALWFWFAYSTGVRAVRSPLPFQHEIDGFTLDDRTKVWIADWTDKDDGSGYHKRELFWAVQTMDVLQACYRYIDRARGALGYSVKTARMPAFFIRNGKAIAISPKSIATVAGSLYPYPPNIHRKVLCRELRAAGCPSEIIRAGVLGHWSTDQEPWSDLSALPLRSIEQALLHYIPPILHGLGLQAFTNGGRKSND